MNYLDRLYNWPTEFAPRPPQPISFWRKLFRALGVVILWAMTLAIGVIVAYMKTGQ